MRASKTSRCLISCSLMHPCPRPLALMRGSNMIGTSLRLCTACRQRHLPGPPIYQLTHRGPPHGPQRDGRTSAPLPRCPPPYPVKRCIACLTSKPWARRRPSWARQPQHCWLCDHPHLPGSWSLRRCQICCSARHHGAPYYPGNDPPKSRAGSRRRPATHRVSSTLSCVLPTQKVHRH